MDVSRKRADQIRPGWKIELNGRTLVVFRVDWVTSEVHGDMVELTFTNSSSVRRTPGVLLEVVR